MPAKRVRTSPRANGKHTGLYLAPDGSWLSAGTFGDRAAAKAAAEHAWKQAQQNDWTNPKGGKTVLGNYAEEVWFPSLVIEIKTKMHYESTWRNHVRPHFGHRAMGSILFTEVKTWLAQMEADGVGRHRQRAAYIVLNMILKSAHADRLIPSIPTAGIKTRPLPQPKPLIFTPKTWEKFLEHLPEYWHPLVKVGMDTGMRPSELRALCPAQINWSRQEITVNRATITASAVSWGSRFIDKGDTKGRRPRTIRVSIATMKILAQIMKERALLPTATDRFFISPTGRPISTEDLSDVFEETCQAAEIPHRCLKHLRSSKASWMLKETGDLVAVKEYLGHASITTTERAYLALVEDEQEEASDVASFEDYLEEA